MFGLGNLFMRLSGFECKLVWLGAVGEVDFKGGLEKVPSRQKTGQSCVAATWLRCF